MSIFKRLFGIGSAEVNSAIDKLEDPVKMTEQGIRDMKKDLDESLKGLATVKAEAIRSRKELNSVRGSVEGYEQKAVLLLQKAQRGEIVPAEADRLASAALTKKEQTASQVQALDKVVATNDQAVANMEQNVNKLRQQISTWETELKTLKARAKVSEAATKLNKQLANVDSSGTINMLERMKEKVEEQEALAESYSDIADGNKSVDQEIDQALLGDGGQEMGASSELLALKAKMGLIEGPKNDPAQNTDI